MNWKPASLVFEGGTDEVRALVGKRVRAQRDVQLFSFHGGEADSPLGPPMTIRAGEIAFVANPYKTMLVLAFAQPAQALPGSLAALTAKGDFRVFCTDWREFRACFQVDL